MTQAGSLDCVQDRCIDVDARCRCGSCYVTSLQGHIAGCACSAVAATGEGQASSGRSCKCRGLDYFNLEGTARDVVVAPLDDHNVVAAVFDHIVDLVEIATQVLDKYFITGSLGSIHTGVDQVVACEEQVMHSQHFLRGIHYVSNYCIHSHFCCITVASLSV